jgi:hypothetical protein
MAVRLAVVLALWAACGCSSLLESDEVQFSGSTPAASNPVERPDASKAPMVSMDAGTIPRRTADSGSSPVDSGSSPVDSETVARDSGAREDSSAPQTMPLDASQQSPDVLDTGVDGAPDSMIPDTAVEPGIIEEPPPDPEVEPGVVDGPPLDPSLILTSLHLVRW